jgi:hypothetical protein
VKAIVGAASTTSTSEGKMLCPTFGLVGEAAADAFGHVGCNAAVRSELSPRDLKVTGFRLADEVFS